MDEHLTREQIAALLDEPDAVAGGLAHLDVCPECAGDFEAMSRARMALSAMPDLEAPGGAWERILDSLPAGDDGVSGADGDRRSRPGLARWLELPGPWAPPLAAAAILVLFFGGLGVGRLLAPMDGGEAAGDVLASEFAAETGRVDGSPDAPSTADGGVPDAYAEYERTVAELRALRAAGPSSADIAADPVLAAERLTRLDALIEASREALRTAPADPALNDFLFEVVDERQAVAGRLGATIRQASMEY